MPSIKNLLKAAPKMRNSLAENINATPVPNGPLFEVQYRPDIVQGLLANYQVIQRCRGSYVVLYSVGGQVY